MGKSRTSEQVQNINPQLENEANNLFRMARQIAEQGYNPYQGDTIAGFNENHVAANQSLTDALTAFGMQGVEAPPEALMGPLSTYEQMMKAPGAEKQLDSVNNLFRQMAKEPPKVKQKTAGGGGKK